MIDKSIENVLNKEGRNIVIPADLVATVGVDNNLQHAFLVLTKVKYAKIPVVDNRNHLKGMLSLPMITEQMLQNSGINSEVLNTIKVKDIMETNVKTVHDKNDFEMILGALVDENFLPLVNQENEFLGIITRRELFKQFNFLVHNYSKYYVALHAYMQVPEHSVTSKQRLKKQNYS